MTPFFVYGSLKSEPFQQRIFGRPVPMTEARLHDYQLVLIVDFPSVIPFPGRWVDGFVIELSDEEISRADKWEGDDHVKFEAQVEIGTSDLFRKTWIYRSLEKHQKEISEYQVSVELLGEVDKYLE